ncbi:hypothetical protein PAECIP111891_01770 [Paenibacillus allorhizoplanae]|uniref:Uncharacterized protein n=1 Tax=Paenibacillus allorhizoplanae TaxID=2905648 RepID=A0ABM9C1U1_9BACL|nr:hypothetical protein PAECIP111891_01770 [Paenibacillus allorhizoplanae]
MENKGDREEMERVINTPCRYPALPHLPEVLNVVRLVQLGSPKLPN